jgi:hypothetical protein
VALREIRLPHTRAKRGEKVERENIWKKTSFEFLLKSTQISICLRADVLL